MDIQDRMEVLGSMIIIKTLRLSDWYLCDVMVRERYSKRRYFYFYFYFYFLFLMIKLYSHLVFCSSSSINLYISDDVAYGGLSRQ